MNRNQMLLTVFVTFALLTFLVLTLVLVPELDARYKLTRLYSASDQNSSSESEMKSYYERGVGILKHFLADRTLRRFGEVTEAEEAAESAEGQRRLPSRRNVLFIIADGLRPQLGAYHDSENPDYFGRIRTRTPNLDRLASRSIVFRNAYVQYSLCGPSRTSMLTSRRPDMTGVYSNRVYWRDVGGNFTTLPQHFKDNGYLTVGLGKVFHPGESSNGDDPTSWTEPYYYPPHTDRQFADEGSMKGWSTVPEDSDVPLMDASTTKVAKEMLKNLSARARTGDQPFFMAVGYNKPHMRLVCPRKYFEMYPLEDEDSFLADKTWQTPKLLPHKKMQAIRTPDGDRVMPSDHLRNLRRAYFACISYVDDLVGDVLGQLEELDLDKNTVVSFVADHGFHLGEHRHWGKTTNWDMATRVPMMIRVPEVTDRGLTSSAVVEALDLFPTLTEAAGLDPVPRCPDRSADVELCTDGASLMPLLRKPNADIRQAAFSQTLEQPYMCYTLRTRSFRLIDCVLINKTNSSSRGHVISVHWPPDPGRTQFFDHEKDALERVNLVNDTRYAKTIKELRDILQIYVLKGT